MHSSAFSLAEGAYLVVGDSGAGKSTTAVALARLLPGSGWMGNDRIHLDRHGDGYEVTPCPLPLAVNKGSLDVMGVTDFSSWPVRDGIPGSDSDWDQYLGEDKLKLSSREVSRFLGVRVVPKKPLAGVILPRVDLGSDYLLKDASRAHAEEVITRNCLSLEDNLNGEDWLQVPVRTGGQPASLSEFIDYLTRIPVLRCSLGEASHVSRLAESLPELLSTNKGFLR